MCVCHRHGIGDVEKMMGMCVAMVIVNFSMMPVNVQANWTFPLHMHSGFPTEEVVQMIKTSFYDVTRISHAIGEGAMSEE